MKRLIGLALMFAVLTPLSLGCSDTASKKTTTTTEGPGGKTSVENETKVKESGNNPPAANP